MQSTIIQDYNGIIAVLVDYNVQKLTNNKWLLTISHDLLITICPNKISETVIVKENLLLLLQPNCILHAIHSIFASSEENETITWQLYFSEIHCDPVNIFPRKKIFPVKTDTN